MNRPVRVVRILAVFILIALSITCSANSRAAAQPGQVSRPWAPIILKPTDLPGLTGAPANQIAVWASTSGGLHPILSQIDRVTGEGYVGAETGVFEGSDELVFMAGDMGSGASRIPPGAQVWYEVTVSDPLDPTAQGIAYVARMKQPVTLPSEFYVRYDAAAHLIAAQSYSVAFDGAHPIITSLKLAGSDTNWLDRSKARVLTNVCFTTCLTFDEEQLPLPAVQPVVNGPVRVVLGHRGGFAYRDWLTLRHEVSFADLGPIFVNQVRLSYDLAPTAVGATYRDAKTLGGVPIDGTPDAVPLQPFSPWRQIDLSAGRLVSLFNVTTPSGRLMNYYKDDKTPDASDTGDGQSYGDNGVIIDEPGGDRLGVDAALWLMPGNATADGATLAAQAATPLRVEVRGIQLGVLYLPLLSQAH